MKKLRDLFHFSHQTDDGEYEAEVGFGHIAAVLAILVLLVMTCQRLNANSCGGATMERKILAAPFRKGDVQKCRQCRRSLIHAVPAVAIQKNMHA